jgi:hypothetical protein
MGEDKKILGTKHAQMAPKISYTENITYTSTSTRIEYCPKKTTIEYSYSASIIVIRPEIILDTVEHRIVAFAI